MKLYYIVPIKAYATEKALFNYLEEIGNYPSDIGLLIDDLKAENQITETEIDELPKRGISKNRCDEIRKEITNELMERFERKEDIFSNDSELIKKAFLLMANAENIVEKRNYPFTMSECKEYFGLHFTEKHTGKMSGNVSLSTACKANRFCVHRMNENNKMLICFYCFAESQLNNYGISMLKPFLFNIWLLNRFQVSKAILPLLNNLIFRFESFGDVMSLCQEMNYLRLIDKNPETKIAQWTKNLGFLKQAFDIREKPENMIVIYSNPFIDKPEKLENIKNRFWFVDKVFNVISEEYAKEHGIKFTCGARHCLTCRNCYSFNNLTEITEKLRDAKTTEI